MERQISIKTGDSRAFSGREAAAGLAFALIQSVKTLFLMQNAVCKFEPSCARYARDAIKTLPPHIAAVKIIWRTLRCNPFSKGGYDPVIKKPMKGIHIE
jgi:putative membrane protein insertion efficiency factor